MNAREALDLVADAVEQAAPLGTLERDQHVEAIGVLRELVDLGVVWVPGRWWRVNLPDGTCWSETSDRDEARRHLVTGREAAQRRELDGEPVLLRLWETSTARRYRVVPS